MEDFFQYLAFFWQNSVFAIISWFFDMIWNILFSSESTSDKDANTVKSEKKAAACISFFAIFSAAYNEGGL